MQPVAGIVLCGGQSNRMGRPKCWLPFSGELMLPRIVRVLSEVVSPIVVVAAAGQELPSLPPDGIVAFDSIQGLGPLHGLAVGLAALSEDTDAAYVSSCDVPFLRTAFVRRIIEMLGDSQACVPQIDGRLHPLAAAYRREIGTVAKGMLDAGQNRLRDLFAAVATRIVTAAELTDVDPDLISLRNVNTPEEYAAALRELPK